jgi:hypothetical protein
MANLFGREWTRAELLAHVGDLSQVAGVRLIELSDGVERGVRAADVRTGGGLELPCCWIAGWTSALRRTRDFRWHGFRRRVSHILPILSPRGWDGCAPLAAV